jgi:hypothetical protein
MSRTSREEKVWGEKNAQYPIVTPKSTTSHSSTPTAYPSKKVTHSSSGGGRDKNPPSDKIKSSHKLPVRKKKKTFCKKRIDLGEKVISTISPLRIWSYKLTLRKCSPMMTN